MPGVNFSQPGTVLPVGQLPPRNSQLSATYLLRCAACGRHVAVKPRQAGQQVHCACGAKLSVPTMRELTRLPRAEDEEIALRRGGWGGRQRLFLAGMVVVFLSLGLGIALVVCWPIPPEPLPQVTPQMVRRTAGRFSALQSWQAWQMLRQTGVDPGKPPQDLEYLKKHGQYEEALFRFRVAAGVEVLIAATGVALLTAAVLQGRTARGRT